MCLGRVSWERHFEDEPRVDDGARHVVPAQARSVKPKKLVRGTEDAKEGLQDHLRPCPFDVERPRRCICFDHVRDVVFIDPLDCSSVASNTRKVSQRSDF